MNKKKEVFPTFQKIGTIDKNPKDPCDLSDPKDALWQARVDEIKNRKQEQELVWKQDCRRTALNLAERFSKADGNSHESDPVKIIANAEVLYVWLTESSTDAIEIFKKSGVLKFHSPNS